MNTNNFKKVFLSLVASFTFLFSHAAYVRGPQSISISGGGTFCVNESTTIAASVTTGHLCGSGGSTYIAYTIKIYSNTTNSTTGGTLVQTCSVASGTGNSTCNYTATNATAGTLYYYAVAEWTAYDCTGGGSITSSTATVVVQSTCVTCSSLLVYNDQYGNYDSHNSSGVSSYSSKIQFNNPDACSAENTIRTAYCNNDYGYAQACDEFNNSSANVSSTSQAWYYFDFTPASSTVSICGIEIYIWGYGNSSGTNKAARDVQMGYSIGGGAWTTSNFGMVSDNNDCETTHTPAGRKVTWTFPSAITTSSNIRVRIQPYNGNAATNSSYEIDLFQVAIQGVVPSPLSSLVFKAEGISEKESNTINWIFENPNSAIERFIVQKSEDGVNFTGASEVFPKYNVSRYTYTDNSPFQTNYYKVLSVDKNGNIASSNTIILKQKKGSFVINSIYPNPTKNELNIAIDVKDRMIVNAKIYNMLGEIVYSVNIKESSETMINTENFKSGIYTLVVSSENETQTERIIIQH